MYDGDLLAEFARDQKRRGLSRRTISVRDRTLRLFLADVDPMVAAAHDIEEWLDTRRLGPSSRGSYLSTLCMFFDFIVHTRRREDNPATEIRRPRVGRRLPHPISRGDLAVALAHADPRMRCWLTLGAFQGLRCIEIAQLRREDVQETNSPPIIVVREGKGKKDRILPLNADVELALRSYGMRHGYLFHVDGKPVEPGTVSSYIWRYLHGLGIEASAHALRHFFGSSLYHATKDIRLVQEMMGHASPQTTAIYVAFDPREAFHAVRTLGVHAGDDGGHGGTGGEGAGGDRPGDPRAGTLFRGFWP